MYGNREPYQSIHTLQITNNRMDVDKYRRTNVLFQVAHLYGREQRMGCRKRTQIVRSYTRGSCAIILLSVTSVVGSVTLDDVKKIRIFSIDFLFTFLVFPLLS